MEARGIHESAKRAYQLAGSILTYSVASGYCTRNPAADLRGALAPPQVTHYASITDPREVGGLQIAALEPEGRLELGGRP